MNIGEIRKALAATLNGLSINAYSYAPDAPNSPAAFIYPEPGPYHPTFSGGDDQVFVVRFLVQSTNSQAGQDQLDELITDDGPGSAVAAMEGDPTLGGLATSVVALEMRNYGVVALSDQAVRYLSAEVLVWVLSA